MLKRLVVLSAVFLSASLLAACGGESNDTAEDPAAGASDSATVTCEYPADGTEAAREVEAPSEEAPSEGTVSATIATNHGDIGLTLDREKAPCTVNSFVSLVEQGFYDDTPCHRLTTSGIYVLQCGDPDGSGMGGPGYTISDEVDGSETYSSGTLAMAKTQMPDSGGSQFFMVYDESPLPPDYTVFGEIGEDGLKLLQEIGATGTDTGAGDGAPKESVQIESVTIG